MIAIAVDDERPMLQALTEAVSASPDIRQVHSFGSCHRPRRNGSALRRHYRYRRYVRSHPAGGVLYSVLLLLCGPPSLTCACVSAKGKRSVRRGFYLVWLSFSGLGRARFLYASVSEPNTKAR